MKHTTRALIAAVALTALTGCGASADSNQDRVDEQQERLTRDLAKQERKDEWEERVYPITKTLDDGRKVSCLVLPVFEMADLECDFVTVQPSTEVAP